MEAAHVHPINLLSEITFSTSLKKWEELHLQ